MDIPVERIVELGGVTPAYARMLRSGDRSPSLALALRLYDGTGRAFGPIAGLSPDEIATARKMSEAA